MAEISISKPAVAKTPVYELDNWYKRPASGGPTIALIPRQKMINPNVVERRFNPSRSTNMIEVNDMYDAINTHTHTRSQTRKKLIVILSYVNNDNVI